MSASDPVIDLMELADIGQPRKLALEIHKQLRAQYGSVPDRVPLDGIARAVGIVAIDDFDTDRFEGTLVVQGEKGAIGLRRGLNRGRRNFTLGHELGHFLNPWHRTLKSRFECDSAAVKAARAAGFTDRPALEQIEVEANEFAATLLVPLPEYRTARKALGSDEDVVNIRTLAERFDVSQEFLARLYVDQADAKIGILMCKDGLVRRFILPREFPYLGLKLGQPISRETLTHEFRRTHPVGTASNLQSVATTAWLERRGDVSALYEQVLLQRDGWTTTLLVIDEDEDADDDDRNWNRRNTRFR